MAPAALDEVVHQSSSSSSSSWSDGPLKPPLEIYKKAPLSCEVSTNAPESCSSDSSSSSSEGDGPAVWGISPSNAEKGWNCAACTFINDVGGIACVLCGTLRPAAGSEACPYGSWQCGACTLLNDGGLACAACNEPRPCVPASCMKQWSGYGEGDESDSKGKDINLKGLQGALIASYNPAEVLQCGEPAYIAKNPLSKVKSSQPGGGSPDSTPCQPRQDDPACGPQYYFPNELELGSGQPWPYHGSYPSPGSFISSGNYHPAPGSGWGRADAAAYGFLEGVAQRWFSCCGRQDK